MRILKFSAAKADLSNVFDAVERAGVRVVARRKSPRLALLRHDEVGELLAEHYPFTTQVSEADDGTVSVWLDQLALYGRGESYDEALDNLLDEIEAYLEDWEARLHRVRNHQERRWWVHRLQLASDRDELRASVVPAPATGIPGLPTA